MFYIIFEMVDNITDIQKYDYFVNNSNLKIGWLKFKTIPNKAD
jgi:hypothetical protein